LKFQAVIGLEIHAQLKTVSKIFCADEIVFGAEPNRHVSAVSLAHPGTLPKLNKRAVELAVKLGAETGMSLQEEELRAIRTIGDTVDIIHKHLNR